MFRGAVRSAAALGVLTLPHRVVHQEPITHGGHDKSNQSFQGGMIEGYEQRIRKFSRPEKIFSVFATDTTAGQLTMTPFDFVKSLMPCDESKRDKINQHPPECFKLLDSDGSGTLDFMEYMLLLALLAVPQTDAVTLFNVLDLDGSQSLDAHEFDQLVETIGQNSALANQRGAPRAMHVSQQNGQHHGASAGAANLDQFAKRLPGGKDRVTEADFLKFVHGVHEGVLELEFRAHGGHMSTGITPTGFQSLVAGYASGSKEDPTTAVLTGFAPNETVSFEDCCHFHEIVLQIDQIQAALVKYGNADGDTTTASRWELQHAINAVTGSRLTVTQASVIMQMFDQNDDGSLNRREFFSVLKSRAERGKTPNFEGVKKAGQFFTCIQKCITG